MVAAQGSGSQSLSAPATSQDAVAGEASPEESFVLPFFGDAARERGHDLPRPLGVGATAAAGYKDLFASLDFNITRSELGNLSTFTAKLTTLRVGWNGELDGMPLRAYTGASYWDTKRTIEGSITNPGGGPVQSIQFAVDQEPVDPVTVLLGSSLTITDRLWIMLEVQGWSDTQALLGGVTLRF